jgi:tetratricopeptide (TPR) repeat protein
MEAQMQKQASHEGKPNEISLGRSILIIVCSLLVTVGAGIYVGKKIFWNQYEQTPVIDRQLHSLLVEVQQNQDKPDKFIELGNLYLEKKDWVKAEDSFNQALKIQPQSTKAQYDLAVTFLAQNRFQDALKILEPMAAKYPKLDYVQFNTGVAFYELGKYDQALPFLQVAASLQSGGADIWYYIGLSYEKTGNKINAQNSYEKALSYIPNYKEAQDALNRVK